VGTNIRKPTTEFSAEEYSFLMATNLESAYHLCQIAHPLLKQSGSGSIVFISSVCGVVGVLSGTIYAMTKGNSFSSIHIKIPFVDHITTHVELNLHNYRQVLFRCH
jgi:short-subunit dehydrogenase